MRPPTYRWGSEYCGRIPSSGSPSHPKLKDGTACRLPRRTNLGSLQQNLPAKSSQIGTPWPASMSMSMFEWATELEQEREKEAVYAGARPQHKWGRTPRFGCPPPLNYMWRLSAFSIPIIASVQSVGDQLKTPEALHAAVSPTSRVHRRTARLSRDRSRFLCTAGHP